MDQVQIFISYAREDQERVKEFYHRLVEAGFHPWLDREHLLPGMKWEPIIKAALKRADFALVCLSATSINKRGFLQKEIKEALEQAKEKLEDDIWLITARLDDCEVPEILADIQWVDLFEDDGWQQLLQALEHQLKKDGKPMPLPVSEQRKRQQEEEEELKRREQQRQRELEEQQRRAEAARLLAKQQRREQELAEQRCREQELAEKQRREQELAEQRRREEEIAEQQRRAEEERKRKEDALRRQSAAQPAPQKQPGQSRQARVARPNPLAFLLALPLSHKLFALAVLALAIISPIVYLSLNRDRPSGEVDAGTPAPTVTGVPATPTPSTLPAPVEVLRVRQKFNSEQFKLNFTARQNGYLYLIAPNENDRNKPLTVFLAGQALRPDVEFEFPDGNDWIERSTEPAKITLIFSPAIVSSTSLAQLNVAESSLGEAEQAYLQAMRKLSDERRATEIRVERDAMTIYARSASAPLVAEITVGGKAKVR